MSSPQVYMAKARQARALDPGQRLLLKPDTLRIMDHHYEVCQVIGSTGKVYDVTLIGNETSCTCPDHTNHNTTCKHIYFILSQVLRLPERVWKRGTEFSDADAATVHTAVDKALKEKWDLEMDKKQNVSATDRAPRDDQLECPVCLCDFDGKEKTLYCKKSCGYVFHTICISRCAAKICPMCRTPL
jgi:hypothetical protein